MEKMRYGAIMFQSPSRAITSILERSGEVTVKSMAVSSSRLIWSPAQASSTFKDDLFHTDKKKEP